MKQVARVLLKNHKWEYLLVKHMNTDKWALPGGHIEKWESLHKAIKREVREEFNLKIDILWEVPNYDIKGVKSIPLPVAIYKIEYISNRGKHVKKTEYVFHAETKDLSQLQIQEKEIRDHIWVHPSKIDDLEEIFEQIPKILKQINSNHE